MKLPQTYYNWISLMGTIIVIFSLIVIIFLTVLSSFFTEGGTYLGLFSYIVVPVFLVFGLLLIPLGMLRQIRKGKNIVAIKPQTFPVMDFNQASQRKAFTIFSVGTLVFIMLTFMGSYEAYHYTESVQFCGTLCHQVMEPEYVGYQNSPHARVACVECHVGNGAGWYVKSKLSGLYQVYAVTMGVYPRPIPTPITSLRPARETCEKCHWPQKFYSRSLRLEKHFLPDEANSEWNINLEMKTGAQTSGGGLSEGIHWHINPDVKIEYQSSPDRERIPWVKYTNLKTGEVKIFKIPGSEKVMAAASSPFEERVMDCMDCHNRPSHTYNSPMKFVNELFSAGVLPTDLPDLKNIAMQALNNEYPSTETAHHAIDSMITDYYRNTFSEGIPKEVQVKVASAISELQKTFSKNIFPYMKVNWKKYPNHIGHLETEGCFRCHDDKHRTEKGDMIRMDCNLCHSIKAQGLKGAMASADAFGSLEFVHPNDEEGGWKEYHCYECHKDVYQSE